MYQTVLHNLKKVINITVIFLVVLNLNGQESLSKFSGIYGDWTLGLSATTELELKSDGTFKLKTVDYVYPQTFKRYSNKGTWVSEGKEITLNPELELREPTVFINEKVIGLRDSVEIKVNHYVERYENNTLVKKELADFEMLTICLGKQRKNINLLRKAYIRKCGWAPRIRNQKIVDSTNTFRIAKKDLDKIGIYTYGFSKPIETELKNRKADHLEINVVVPIDNERMPRSKKVIIKGRRAYFYERNGKIDQFWAEPLRKKAL